MRDADVPAVERLTGAAFAEVGLPVRDEAGAASWQRRARHLLGTDPGGAWVADDAGSPVGGALALRREGLWLLSAYAVAPAAQGAGIGRALLDPALGYGSGCLRGMIASSADPRAVRRYRLAGFTLHADVALRGTVDRAAIPAVDAVRDGDAADRDLLDSVDRQVRGAGHGPDHVFLGAEAGLLVCDTFTGSGYCYWHARGPVLLAATTRRVAIRLAWEALARTPPGAEVAIRHVTAENEWALDVGLAAGLAVHRDGYLFLRGMRPPAPYVPSGAFL